jgi:glutamate decarboxylase
MLGGLAMKRKWVNMRKEKNQPYDKPNMIMCSTVQVAWKKFCCYFDVEPRYANITKESYVLSPEEAIKLVDENTIGVVAVLGSTYTGHFEPIEELNNALMKLNKEKGLEVGIHVDAASGGFVAPFLYPDLLWDFRLPLVKSINVSCHKYGLVYPGVSVILLFCFG